MAEGSQPKHELLAESRRTTILELLRSSGEVSVAEMERHLGVSRMTVRRDLAVLADQGLADRTRGGATIAHEGSLPRAPKDFSSGSQPKEPLLAESRRSAILEMLRANGAVSVTEIETQLGVSSMTARRDLASLASRGLAQRTHGGAVIPRLSSHEDSFAQRLESGADAKRALAEVAAQRVQPRDSVYIDSSTSGYFVARQLLEAGIEVTLLTNSLPIMHMVGANASPNVHLIAIGGVLRPLTQSFVGPYAVGMIGAHYADHTFMSVKALPANGVMLDADQLEAEIKRNMISHAVQSVLLVDRSKLAARGLHAIAPVSDIEIVLAYGVDDADLRALEEYGTAVQSVG